MSEVKHISQNHLIDSSEVRLIMENKEYFSFIPELSKNGVIPDELRARAKRTIIETNESGGEKEVLFRFFLDDNMDINDGSVTMQDSFIFDASESILLKFQRGYRCHDPEGSTTNCDHAKKILEATKDNTPSEKNRLVQDFAFSVARGFRRFFAADASSALREAFVNNHGYIKQPLAQAAEVHPFFQLRLLDANNYYTVGMGDEGLRLTFSWLVDADEDPENGRLWVKDSFVLNPSDFSLRTFARAWEEDPAMVASGKDYSKLVEQLNGEISINKKEASKFLNDIWPRVEFPSFFPEVRHAAPELATELYQKGRSDLMGKLFESAAENFLKAIQVNPEAPGEKIKFYLGVAYFGAQKWDLALRFLNEVRDALTDYDNREKQVLYRALAVANFKLGSYKEAADLYRIILVTPEFQPSDTDRLELGRTYLEINNRQAAVEIFDGLIRKDPTNAEYFYYRGLSWVNQSQAEWDFQKAIELKPDYAEAYLQLAKSQPYWDTEAIDKNLKKALAHGAPPARVDFVNGLAKAQEKRYEEAFPLLLSADEAISEGLEYHELQMTLGAVQMALGKHEDAEKSFSKVITDIHGKLNPAALHERGLALYEQGRYTEAKADFSAEIDAGGYSFSSTYYLLMSKLWD